MSRAKIGNRHRTGKGRKGCLWAGLGATLAGIGAFLSGSLQNTVGNLAATWIGHRSTAPEIRVRYFELPQQRLTPRGPSYPLNDRALSGLFQGETVYIEHNEVLDRLASLAKNLVEPFPLGEAHHHSLEDYQALLGPNERSVKSEIGSSNSEILWGLSALVSGRRLLERGVLKTPAAIRLASANPELSDLFYIQVGDSRATCDDNEHGGPPGTHDFKEEIVAPEIRVIVLIVDNISQSPVRLLGWRGREYRDHEGLRVSSSLEPRARDKIVAKTSPFSIGVLLPREHLLVPLVVMARKFTLPSSDARLDGHPSNRPFETIQLNSDYIADQYHTFADSATDFYFFGPVVRVDALNVGGSPLVIRDLVRDQFTYSVLNLSGGTGSCPNLRFLRRSARTWTTRTHVLVGAQGRGRARTEVRPLDDFGGELVILEDEDETSVIRSLEVQTFDGQRWTTACRSAIPAGEPATLRRGNMLRLRCPLRGALSARLVVDGYYSPAERVLPGQPMP